MASGIPTTRRTTRGTRAGGGPSVLDENAHLRTTSAATGLSAPAGSSKAIGAAGKDAGQTGRASASSRVAAAAKTSKEPATTSSTVGKQPAAATRRRAAFGEVSNRNGGGASSSTGALAGKKAAADGKAATAAAPPKRKTRTSLAAEQAAADLEALQAAAGSTETMAVDEPVQPATGVGRPTAASRHRAAAMTSTRPTAKTSTTATVTGSSRTTAASAAPSATSGPSTRRTVNGASTGGRAGGASAAASTVPSASATAGPSSTVNHPVKREKPALADDASGIPPAAKRARTSSPEKPTMTVDDVQEGESWQVQEAQRDEEDKLYHERLALNREHGVADDFEEDADDMAIPGESAVRARAKDEGWEDLDEEDEFDPMMVSEYVREIFVYMQRLELTTAPNPEYMDIQPELQWKMRAILIDWLIEVHGKFRLLPETLFLAVNLVDRFLSARVISLVKLQLVGTTALFVAAKYEEVICPSVTNFLYMADNGFQDDEILGAERYLLQTLDFNLSYPNPIHFLRRISKADNYDIQTRTVAKYYMEIACVDHKMLHLKPSEVAAGAAWLARHVLDRGEWNANLVHYSGFSEDELLPAAQLMLNYILRPREKQAESFVKKYASKKYMKASTYSRDWAVGRYRDDGIMADAPKGGELRYDINAMRAERAILEESDEDL